MSKLVLVDVKARARVIDSLVEVCYVLLDALEEILSEADSDKDWDIVRTAAKEAMEKASSKGVQ